MRGFNFRPPSAKITVDEEGIEVSARWFPLKPWRYRLCREDVQSIEISKFTVFGGAVTIVHSREDIPKLIYFSAYPRSNYDELKSVLAGAGYELIERR